ncbi:MAG: hypothetical protein RLY20_3056, partial [Verrucomicrobiota bacterium]
MTPKPTLIRRTQMLLAGAAAFLSFCGIAPAAPVSFTGVYSENFDSLSTAGTTMPVG